MEDLTKHQLVLLTLLVSFVTSIATGIITFTLLQQAPVEVTNTINRVVEKTIEQVTPTDGGKTSTKEVQVVNEEDLVLSSIDKNTKSIVRIQTKGADGSDIISGLGLVISDKGIVMMDARSFDPNNADYAIFPDGRSYSADKVYTDPNSNFVFMRLSRTGHGPTEPAFVPAVLGDSSILRLGQSIIQISGKNNNSVNIGRISEMVNSSDGKTLSKITSDISSSGALPGSPLLNISGEIVGFQAPIGNGETTYSFTPINSVKDLINKATSDLSK